MDVLKILTIGALIFSEPQIEETEEFYTHKDFQLYEQLENALISSETDILEEKRLGEMELLSQLVMAEAGNQGLDGMRLVADVVLNRRDCSDFPNTIEEVIYQEWQFTPTVNGSLEAVGWFISEDAFRAVEMEMNGPRLDDQVLYFNTEFCEGSGQWKYGDHWFGY